MFFAHSDWFSIQEYPRIFLARMTAHEIANMASWLPEDSSEAQIPEINEKTIPINTKKAMKFSFGVFQGRVSFLNFVLRLNFTREAELVTLARNGCQLPSLFTNFKIRHKNIKIVIFSSLIHWLVYANVIIHRSVGEKPSIFTTPHSPEYPGLFTSTSVNNCSLFTSTSWNNYLSLSVSVPSEKHSLRHFAAMWNIFYYSPPLRGIIINSHYSPPLRE